MFDKEIHFPFVKLDLETVETIGLDNWGNHIFSFLNRNCSHSNPVGSKSDYEITKFFYISQKK